MIINKTKFLEFKSAKSPSGSDWYYVRRTNDKNERDSAVVITTIVKIDSCYNFLFLKTKRPPILAENKAKYCLESPAGLIGDVNKNESILECAKKELLEETGLIADEIFVELINSSTSAGLSSETLSYVTAIVDDYKLVQKPVDDGGIIEHRLLVPIANIYNYLNYLNKNEISVSCALVCGLFYALKRVSV